jgi:Ribophorin I
MEVTKFERGFRKWEVVVGFDMPTTTDDRLLERGQLSFDLNIFQFHSRKPSLSPGAQRMAAALLFFELLAFVFLCLSSSVAASIPQTLRHTNLLRTIDLSKPYIRDSTALILENISNTTHTEYFWGIPHELVPKLSYLEVREKKTGATEQFPVEQSEEQHPYPFRDIPRLTIDCCKFTKCKYLN